MESKIVKKREYTITITKEEAEILSDLLEHVPRKNGKRLNVEQKRIKMADDLFEHICNMLESEDD